MVTAIFRKMVSKKSKRRIIGMVLVVTSFLLALGPLFISPDVRESIGHNKKAYTFLKHDTLEIIHNTQSLIDQEKESDKAQKHKQNQHDHSRESEIEIFGYMSISEVSEEYGIPTEYLKVQIGVPVSTANNLRLGQLKKRYNFSMGDVKKAISNE